MNSDLDYNILIDKAMRDIVKLALKKVQKINNENFCFLFTINTKNKNVILPDYIKKQYPEEITIILQHQFSSLIVKNSNFSVDLSFAGKLEHVVVPFSSITFFSDKMAGIELNFNYYEENIFIYNDEDEEESYNEYESENGKLINFEDIRRKK